VVREKVSQAAVADGGGEGGGSSRTEYLYDGQMPVCEQEFAGSTLRTTRVNFLGARGIEAVVAIDHTRGNAVALRWLLYDGHGNLVRLMAPDYRLSTFQWRGVWGEGQGSLGTLRGYCANLGHPEDETGLVYMRARYYELATGRFISEDPARDGVNWYLYADGNPVRKIDFTGKSAQDEYKSYAVLGTLLATVAYGIMLANTILEIMAWLSGGPISRQDGDIFTLLKVTYLIAVGFATIATALFAAALSGLQPSVERILLASSIYLGAVSMVVAVYDALVDRAGFTVAGVAVGAAFTYNLLVLSVLYINEFEQRL